jgi:UDP:flavonoid glycosyltransferase YjiC (YdhE family)
VRSVIDDPTYRTKAALIAESMARAGGLNQVAEVVDGLGSRARTAPE